MKYYAGIGSRNTPKDVLNIMVKLGEKLQDKYILRSGGADGADKAFALNVKINKEIYIPWNGFKNLYADNKTVFLPSTFENYENAKMITKSHHPAYDKLFKKSVRSLMHRNVYQILGQNLNTPVNFVVCWTLDGCISNKERGIKTGGTGQAISIADTYNIPVFNLKREDHRKRIENFLKK